MRILAGIDLPGDLVCGSLLLARDLYAELRADGNDVRFFALPGTTGEANSLLEFEPLNIRKGATEDASYVSALRMELARQLGGWTPDVIHCHHLGYGMSQALQLLGLRAPALAIAHGTDVYDARTDPHAHAAATRVVGRSDAVVFPSVALAAEAAELGLALDPYTTFIVPWGAHPPKGSSLRRGSRPPGIREIRLVVGARLTKNKDVATAIRAIRMLPTHYRLIVYGEGREQGPLETLIDELGLRERVRIAAPLCQALFWAELAKADCALFPTRGTEAFGLFGIECQALGLPIIRSDIAVFDEVFGSSSGRFRAGDPDDLAREIRRTCEHEAAWKVLQLVGLINARRYTVRRTAQSINAIAKTFIASNTGASYTECNEAN